MRQRETKRAPFATRLKNQASFRYFTKTLFTKIKKSTQKNSKKRKKRRLLSLKRPEFQQRIVHAQRHGSTKKQTKICKNAVVILIFRKQYFKQKFSLLTHFLRSTESCHRLSMRPHYGAIENFLFSHCTCHIQTVIDFCEQY